jgi:hypothetical protein
MHEHVYIKTAPSPAPWQTLISLNAQARTYPQTHTFSPSSTIPSTHTKMHSQTHARTLLPSMLYLEEESKVFSPHNHANLFREPSPPVRLACAASAQHQDHLRIVQPLRRELLPPLALRTLPPSPPSPAPAAVSVPSPPVLQLQATPLVFFLLCLHLFLPLPQAHPFPSPSQ